MLDLYVIDYDLYKDYNLDLRKLNQEVINHVIEMDEEQRELSIFSYYYLIELLKSKGLEHFELNFDGKPRIVGNPLFFNIAHTKGRIIIAISDQEVGVDIEKVDRNIRPELYKKILSEDEKLIYERRCDTSKYFLKCWVKKEAYLKYLGVGIDRRLNQINSENLAYIELIEDEDYYIAVYSKEKDAKLIHKSV